MAGGGAAAGGRNGTGHNLLYVAYFFGFPLLSNAHYYDMQ